MTARYRLLCNGALPGRTMTAGEARRQLAQLPAGTSNLRGDLNTGASWTGQSGYMAGGKPRTFTLTPDDETTSSRH